MTCKSKFYLKMFLSIIYVQSNLHTKKLSFSHLEWFTTKFPTLKTGITNTTIIYGYIHCTVNLAYQIPLTKWFPTYLFCSSVVIVLLNYVIYLVLCKLIQFHCISLYINILYSGECERENKNYLHSKIKCHYFCTHLIKQ